MTNTTTLTSDQLDILASIRNGMATGKLRTRADLAMRFYGSDANVDRLIGANMIIETDAGLIQHPDAFSGEDPNPVAR